jgi:hypothetical protein
MAEIVPFPTRRRPAAPARTAVTAQPLGGLSLKELAQRMRAEATQLRGHTQELSRAVADLVQADLPGQARALADAAAGEPRPLAGGRP